MMLPLPKRRMSGITAFEQRKVPLEIYIKDRVIIGLRDFGDPFWLSDTCVVHQDRDRTQFLCNLREYSLNFRAFSNITPVATMHTAQAVRQLLGSLPIYVCHGHACPLLGIETRDSLPDATPECAPGNHCNFIL